MKALKFVVPLVIVISLLPVSRGVAESNLAVGNSDHTIFSTAPTEPTVPIAARTVADEELAGSAFITDSSTLKPSIDSERPLPDDPHFDKQWALSKIQMTKLWQITSGNPDILVAILDTGIDDGHEDLIGKVVTGINLSNSFTPIDLNGHGTHIAGIIAANSSNGLGITGIAPRSRLMNVKVADDAGISNASTVAKGIIWAVDHGASVINISIEFRKPSSELEDAINYAWRHGAIILAAASNETSQSPVYPAYYENCVAVVATRQDGTIGPLSNYGDWVDVAAPGLDVYSTLPNNGYGYKSGTSFATAHVSGLAALLFNVVSDTNSNGRLNDEIRAAIEAGSRITDFYSIGTGQIDAAGTLQVIGYIAEL